VSYVGRFAPSPSGPLHFGSLVAAVASWLDARAASGTWLVRIEDVDAARTVAGATDAILSTLEALGLAWDGAVMRQRERGAHYHEALERLRRAGALFRCECSRREIADSALRGPEGAVYPGTCRGDAPAFTQEARPRMTSCAVRFAVAPGEVAFDDRVQGHIAQDVEREIGDFVLRRRDGVIAYQLAVVVDDAEQGVTDVVRGADLLGSTARQILLQRALGFAQPRYLHLPVAVDANGEKLSKQTLAPAVREEDGARLIAQALEFLGQAPVPPTSAREMLALAARQWDAQRIPRATTRLALAG
jgi:glutamyl-Q tRNA(Asp) synthetase